MNNFQYNLRPSAGGPGVFLFAKTFPITFQEYAKFPERSSGNFDEGHMAVVAYSLIIIRTPVWW